MGYAPVPNGIRNVFCLANPLPIPATTPSRRIGKLLTLPASKMCASRSGITEGSPNFLVNRRMNKSQ
jgi:hypothetical protein